MKYLILAIIAVLAVMVIATYNSFVSLRNKVNEAFSTMDVYMKKRFDLIPNLVEVVKGYASHEAKTLEEVTAMRNNANSVKDQLSAEANITKTLANVMAVVEKYPDLKADKNFLDLQKQLTQIEDDIACSRRYYNGSVREMNNKVQSFPNNILAGIFGFKSMPMFEASMEERKTVSTEF